MGKSMHRMFLTPSWGTIFKCQRSSPVKQTCQVNCLPCQANKQAGGVQTRQSTPSQSTETSESRTILASAWESERSKGGRGGDREKDRQQNTLLKGKTTPSIFIYFSAILLAMVPQKRGHPPFFTNLNQFVNCQ